MHTQHEQSVGAYDIRKGAAGYAGIMGSVAGFVVPTVILAFTLPRQQIASHQADLTLATGLLVVSLLGCSRGASWFAGLALVGAIAVVIIGILRTVHPARGPGGCPDSRGTSAAVLTG